MGGYELLCIVYIQGSGKTAKNNEKNRNQNKI